VFKALKYYWELSLGFYTNPFMELFLQPRKVALVPDAVVAILAGELHGGWKLWWRRKLFFFLVGFHKRKALVPRLDFT